MTPGLADISAFLDALETCHQCGATLLIEDGPTYCREDGCNWNCDEHEEARHSSRVTSSRRGCCANWRKGGQRNERRPTKTEGIPPQSGA